jgi:hypothetical protein
MLRSVLLHSLLLSVAPLFTRNDVIVFKTFLAATSYTSPLVSLLFTALATLSTSWASFVP